MYGNLPPWNKLFCNFWNKKKNSKFKEIWDTFMQFLESDQVEINEWNRIK